MAPEIVVNFAISETARQCAKIFADRFPNAVSGPTTPDSDMLKDQLARFKIWAGNLGVFTGGHSSADYRLRDDQDIKDVIVKLLQRLADNLKSALPQSSSSQDTSEPEENSDEDEYSSDSSLGLSEDEELQDDEDEVSTKTLLPQNKHIQVIDQTISHLYKITSIIKKPEINSEDQRISRWFAKEGHKVDHQLEELESYISWSLDRKYLRLQKSSFLKDRLVQTVLLRRRRLLYRENHRFKLEHGSHDSFFSKAPELTFRPQRSESKQDHQLDESTPTQPVLPGKAVTFMDTEASVVNRKGFSTYAKSAILSAISPSVRESLRHLDVPPPPESSVGAVCPYCSLLLGRDIIGESKRLQWTRHILQDILPYICLFKNCDIPLTQYMTKDDWINHMASQHTKVWACQATGHEEYVFQNPLDLETHLQAEHPGILHDNQLSFVVGKSARPGPDIFAALAVEDISQNGSALSACPLCNEPEAQLDAPNTGILNTFPRESYTKIRDHISGHLESIALESLPPRDDVDHSLSGHRQSDASEPLDWIDTSLGLQAPRPTSRDSFKVAIFCALSFETEAVHSLFDTHWDDDLLLNKAAGDLNAYFLGAIGCHNVVLVHMPSMEKVEASSAFTSCQMSFPGIKLALLLGICGVAPSSSDGEIILGDVIVSDDVVQYDSWKHPIRRYLHKDILSSSKKRSKTDVRVLLAKIKEGRTRAVLQHKVATNLGALQESPSLAANYPGAEHDNLFEADSFTEEFCSQSPCQCKSVQRRRLQTKETPEPHFHFGTIVSSNVVMKSCSIRDSFAASENAIAFDIQSAGISDAFPSGLVIKGACDYADSHKNQKWQRYAAATAAAFSKALLSLLDSSLSRVIGDTIHHIPFPRNRHFVERKNVMGSLKRLLFEENKTRVALVGMGGIGKTQLALQLTYWVKENMRDCSVFWASARSLESFEQSCGEIAKSLAIQCADGEDPKALVKHYLESEAPGNWLFVLDNADGQSILGESQKQTYGIDDFLPDSNNGRVLVITQSREVAVIAGEGFVVTLSPMSQQESSNLLRKSLTSEDDLQNQKLVRGLLHVLSNSPLSISQAVAYMNINKVSMETYLGLFKNIDHDEMVLLSGINHNSTLYSSTFESAVAATWMMSFKQIHHNYPLAAKLLSFIAYIEPETIPRSILPDSESDEQMSQAIGILCGYGFLTQRGNSPVFDTHDLILLMTRKRLVDQATDNNFRQMAVAHLAETFPLDDWNNHHMSRQYLPHALNVLGKASNLDRDVCELSLRVGRYLNHDGRPRQAIRVLEQVLAFQSDAIPQDDTDRLILQQELARVYRSSGQTREAINLLQHVVAVTEELFEEGHPSRLSTYHDLAVAYSSNGQVWEAIESLKHVVMVREKVLGEGHPDLLASLYELARAYQSNGQIIDAISLLQHIAIVGEQTLGGQHPDLLASQHNLAMAYQSNGEILEAIRLLEHIVAIREKVLGADHPDLLASQRELASAYDSNRQLDEATGCGGFTGGGADAV